VNTARSSRLLSCSGARPHQVSTARRSRHAVKALGTLDGGIFCGDPLHVWCVTYFMRRGLDDTASSEFGVDQESPCRSRTQSGRSSNRRPHGSSDGRPRRDLLATPARRRAGAIRKLICAPPTLMRRDFDTNENRFSKLQASVRARRDRCRAQSVNESAAANGSLSGRFQQYGEKGEGAFTPRAAHEIAPNVAAKHGV
jgi:hypothetical protein